MNVDDVTSAHKRDVAKARRRATTTKGKPEEKIAGQATIDGGNITHKSVRELRTAHRNKVGEL